MAPSPIASPHPPSTAQQSARGARGSRAETHGEHGQALVLVTLTMLILLGMAALAIDVSTWYQRHHAAQVAADAAALAAANCMANVGVTNGTFTDQCTTTSDAAMVATNYAAENGVSIPTTNVSFNGENVTVTTPDPPPVLFASLFGVTSATQTARASATWSAPVSTSCTTSLEQSGACYFAFARDSNCPDVGITLENVGTVRITGGVWSNSDLSSVNADHNSSWGNATFGNGTLCTWIGASVGNGPSFSSGPTPQPPINSWPRDYTSVLQCGPGLTYQCTGPNGTPSYCTQAAPAFGLNLLGYVTSLPSGALPITMTAGQVYCAYGTSTNMSDPTTWNGVIDATSGTQSTSDTFIGGLAAITTQGSVTLSPALTTSLGSLLVYAGDSTVTAANVAESGKANLSGDIFAPNGTITATNSGSGSYTSFLEGNQVVIDAQGNMTGEGPQTGSNGSSSLPGADAMTG